MKFCRERSQSGVQQHWKWLWKEDVHLIAVRQPCSYFVFRAGSPHHCWWLPCAPEEKAVRRSPSASTYSAQCGFGRPSTGRPDGWRRPKKQKKRKKKIARPWNFSSSLWQGFQTLQNVACVLPFTSKGGRCSDATEGFKAEQGVPAQTGWSLFTSLLLPSDTAQDIKIHPRLKKPSLGF